MSDEQKTGGGGLSREDWNDEYVRIFQELEMQHYTGE